LTSSCQKIMNNFQPKKYKSISSHSNHQLSCRTFIDSEKCHLKF